MAQGDIVITVIGNLADDPEMRFTPGGDAVCKFRMASTPRIFDKINNEWKDADPSWVNVTCWRKLAENVVETLKKGSRTIVHGSFRERSYDVEVNGTPQKRYTWELTADEVGAALSYATATITRNEKGGGGQAARGDEVWANASKTPPAQSTTTAPAGPSADTQRTAQAAQGAAPAGEEAPPW
jgi:single-strand DNA-binding protein